MKTRIPGELILLLTAIIWGYGFVAVANSLDNLTPFQLVLLRFGIAAVILIVVFQKNFRKLKAASLKKGSVLGVLFFIGFSLQTFGIQYTTPSKNAFLTGVNVIFVPVIAFFLFKRKLTRQEVFGAILSVIGIGILTLQTDGQVNVGDLLTLGCAVAFAFHIFFTTLFMEHESAIDIAIVQTLTCAILAGIAVLIEGAPMITPDRTSLISVLYLAIFSTMLTTVFQAYGQKTTSETRSAILLSTESLWGTFFSFLFLGEAMTLRLVVGGLIVFGAILLAQIKPKSKSIVKNDLNTNKVNF